MKFKVGDKVKVLGKPSTPASYIGRTGVITALRNGSYCPYTVQFSNGPNIFNARELEKVE